MRIRSYSELVRLETFEEKFEYLRLDGQVGNVTFGFDRWLNQQFYTSREWRQVRQEVIVRDWGCDLGVDGYEVHARLVIHHMNPMVSSDIVGGESDILDPEFLISTAHLTHNAIHYGNASLLPRPAVERRPGDTKLW
jgi:hypothetical protein